MVSSSGRAEIARRTDSANTNKQTNKAPIAPTKECVALVRELEAPVQYIVLPTTLVSAGGRAARGGEY